ncbi:MAG: shikimate dehydrogenase [Bacteroidales bacterium]|nr:shikimate dehydrogenase [Bacteroidales bacterium]
MKHYGLIGHPLGHSFSKTYFTAKFETEGLDCDYQNYDLEDISLIKQSNLNGFNVTIPYKEDIITYLDKLDEVAAEVGAVNTVRVLPNGKLIGFNTDVIGFESLIPHSSLLIPHSSLILGTGGASKAVQYVLKKHGIDFQLVSRDAKKGDYTYDQLTPEIVKDHLLIINSTPVGMAPHIDALPDIPYDAITPNHTLIDLIYNPEITLFLRHGEEQGATTINGLAMLHAQAEASWKVWNS